MLDERKLKAIELIMDGSYEKQEMAKMVGVSRQTLYKWLNKDEEFKAEVAKQVREIKTSTTMIYKSKCERVANEQYSLMMDKDTPVGVRAKLMMDWQDRALGKPTSKIDLNPETNQDNVRIDINTIRAEIAEYEITQEMNNMQENNLLEEE